MRIVAAGAAAVVMIVAAGLVAGCGGHAGSTSRSATSATTGAALSRTVVIRRSAVPAGAGLARVALRVPAANRAFGTSHQVTLPRGWKAEVWALVPGARLETWTPQGDLLVSQPTKGSITELTPRANRSAPPSERTLVSGLTNPQGMAFDTLGGHEVLYVAASHEVDRYVWSNGAVGARSVVIANLPGDGAHPLKNVVVAANHTVYVDIGSATNASPRAQRAATRARRCFPTTRATAASRCSPPASATATACRSRPTARSGRRSTSATTSPTRSTSPTAAARTPTAR